MKKITLILLLLSVTYLAQAQPCTLIADIAVTNVSCKGGNNGKISVTNVRGGAGNAFTFELENGIDPKITQQNGFFHDLRPATYTLTISDNSGCLGQMNAVVKEPERLQVEIRRENSDLLVCYGATNGSISLKIKGGVAPYRIDVFYKNSTRKAMLNSIRTTPPSNPSAPPEASVQTSPILAPGSYYAKIEDASGCHTSTAEFTIEEALNFEPRDVYQIKECQSGKLYDPIAVRFNNPMDFTKLSYELNGVAGNFSRTEGNIAYIDAYDRSISEQSLVLTYTHDHSDGKQKDICKSITWKVQTEEIKPLTINNVPNNTLNTIEINPIGGKKPYTFAFQNKEQGNNPVYIIKMNDPKYSDNGNQTDKKISVKVTDALGCTYTTTIKGIFHNIRVANFFTPDADGYNDTWKPENLDSYPNAKIYIFDRNGRKIHTLLPLSNPWDGKYEGKPVPSGDYWYIITLSDTDNNHKFYGNFTLYR